MPELLHQWQFRNLTRVPACPNCALSWKRGKIFNARGSKYFFFKERNKRLYEIRDVSISPKGGSQHSQDQLYWKKWLFHLWMNIIPLEWWQYCWKGNCANSDSRLIPTAHSLHIYWGESPLTWFPWTSISYNIKYCIVTHLRNFGAGGFWGSCTAPVRVWPPEEAPGGAGAALGLSSGTANPSSHQPATGTGWAHVRKRWITGRGLGVRITSLGMKSISQPDGAEFVYEPGLWYPLSPSGWHWGEVLPADTLEGPFCSSFHFIIPR